MKIIEILKDEELGKWFIEISKYTATVGLVGAILGDNMSLWQFVFALLVTIGFLMLGLWIVKQYREK